MSQKDEELLPISIVAAIIIIFISMMYLSHFTVKDDLRPFKISQKQSEALVFYDCDFARAFMRQMNKHHKFWQWKVMKLVDTL